MIRLFKGIGRSQIETIGDGDAHGPRWRDLMELHGDTIDVDV